MPEPAQPEAFAPAFGWLAGGAGCADHTIVWAVTGSGSFGHGSHTPRLWLASPWGWSSSRLSRVESQGRVSVSRVRGGAALRSRCPELGGELGVSFPLSARPGGHSGLALLAAGWTSSRSGKTVAVYFRTASPNVSILIVFAVLYAGLALGQIRARVDLPFFGALALARGGGCDGDPVVLGRLASPGSRAMSRTHRRPSGWRGVLVRVFPDRGAVCCGRPPHRGVLLGSLNHRL